MAEIKDINARADQIDLGGRFVIPPGDPVSHFGGGFAKILCSNIFLRVGLLAQPAAALGIMLSREV